MCAELEQASQHSPVTPMTPVEQHETAHRIQWFVKQRDQKEKHPLPHMSNYPQDPATLPTALLDFAYGVARPVHLNLVDLEVLASGVPYKITHTAVRQQVAPRQVSNDTQQQIGSATLPASNQPDIQRIMQAMGMMLAQMNPGI